MSAPNSREIEDWESNYDKANLLHLQEGLTLWVKVDEVKAFIHQELQKAREAERERINKDLDRRLKIQKKVLSSEYEGGYTHALQDVKEAYQSKLDQHNPTK